MALSGFTRLRKKEAEAPLSHVVQLVRTVPHQKQLRSKERQ